jgi:hypothetical protein
MIAEVTPQQFERIINLLDEKFKETDLAFYCGLRNNLKEQYEKEKERQAEMLEKFLFNS